MRALIAKDAASKVVILSTDDAYLAEMYADWGDDTLDVDEKELNAGTFYLWTGKSQLTYPSPLDGIGPDGSEFVRTAPLKVIDTGPEWSELDGLFEMSPPPEEEIDLTPRDTIWD